jgi:hypothetical protein
VKTSTAGIAAIATSVALGLTGCAGDSQAADPKVTTPAGPAATSPPSLPPTRTTTTAPPGQSSTRASEEAAAIAVVRSYVAEYNKALKSGSTTAFRATFKESCPLCLDDASRIDETFRKKQRPHGLQATLTSPLVTLHDSGQIWVEAWMSQAGGQLLSASGAASDTFTPVPKFRFLWRVKPGSSPVIFGSERA